MRLWLLLAVCAVSAADRTSDSLRAAFSSLGGLNTCYEPCVGDLIFAARELLFFKDTVNKFKDLCHTYESAQLCVATKELQCMQTSSFAIDASGIEELCDDKEQKFQQQLPCIEKNIDDVLNGCNSQCMFTTTLADLAKKDIVGDAESTNADDQASLGKELGELCPASSCFISCLAHGIDNTCPPAGHEITSAILRPFFIDAGLLAESDPEMVSSSTSSLPEGCKAFLDVESLVNMTKGTFHVSTGAMKNLQSELRADVVIDDSFPEASIETSSPTTELEELADAAGLPECVDGCLSDLFAAADGLFTFQGTIENVQRLCTAYEAASECITSKGLGCVNPAVFGIGLSAVHDLCVNKMSMLEEHADCLSEHLDDALTGCDQTCGITATAKQVTDSKRMKVDAELRSDARDFYKQVAPLCTSLGCFLSCASRSLDQFCAPAGEEITESLLRPFTLITEMVATEGPLAISVFQQVLPSQCMFLLNNTDLGAIAKGVQDDKWNPMTQNLDDDDLITINDDSEPSTRAMRFSKLHHRHHKVGHEYDEDESYEHNNRHHHGHHGHHKMHHQKHRHHTRRPTTTTNAATTISTTTISTTTPTTTTTEPSTTTEEATTLATTTAEAPARDPSSSGQTIVCIIRKNGDGLPATSRNTQVHCQPLSSSGQSGPLPTFPVTSATTASSTTDEDPNANFSSDDVDASDAEDSATASTETPAPAPRVVPFSPLSLPGRRFGRFGGRFGHFGGHGFPFRPFHG